VGRSQLVAMRTSLYNQIRGLSRLTHRVLGTPAIQRAAFPTPSAASVLGVTIPMELCARQFALTLRACFAVIFGMVMDYSEPRLVFWLVAILSLVTLISVFGTGRHARAGRVAAGAD
jgi:hypothetical protein